MEPQFWHTTDGHAVISGSATHGGIGDVRPPFHGPDGFKKPGLRKRGRAGFYGPWQDRPRLFPGDTAALRLARDANEGRARRGKKRYYARDQSEIFRLLRSAAFRGSCATEIIARGF